jgi:RNA polymerase sigma factor (sigma-70 family)
MESLCHEDPRARALLNREIGFVFNEEFPTIAGKTVLERPAELYADRDARASDDAPRAESLDSMSTLPVLSAAGERFLFRKMNYLKYRANRLRVSLRADGTDAAVEEIETLLEDADAARNHIAECNVRLIASIARRFATAQTDFDELVSEANMILLKAIDKFDYARGFRFSTYLTHSVQRHFYRFTQTRRRRKAVELSSEVDVLNAASAAAEPEPVVLEGRVEDLVERMGECLDDRERFVIRERFGLGEGNVVRTLRDIAREIGLSKERVRQIQIAAVEKLRDFFDRIGAGTACA